MYIEVSSALKQDDIIELLNTYEGDVSFEYAKKSGLNLLFDFTGPDAEEAAGLAKKLIKDTSWGAALYLRVRAVNK